MTTISVKDVGAIGMVADAQPHELPANAWTDARNIRFRDGFAERFLGHAAVFGTPAVTPYYIDAYQASSKKYWIHAGINAVYADDGTTRTDITGTAPTGVRADRWSGGTLNGVFVLNNGVDAPMFWGGNTASNLATLTGWPVGAKAAVIRPFKNYLIALDVTKGATRYASMVKWSHAADPGTVPISWDEANPALDAGEQDLAETPDFLVDGLPLGDVFIIYKQRSMYAMTFQGQPFIWRFQRLPGDYGALARGCVANTPAGHVVLTAGDVVVHSGQGAKSILTGRMRRWLFSKLDAVNYAAAFVTTNPWRNEAWICFPGPEATACTLALVWNWNDNTFGVRELDNVSYGAAGQMDYSATSIWASDAASWESDTAGWNYDEFNQAEARLLLASTTPAIHAADVSADFAAAPVSAMLERTGLALEAPDMVKMVRAIYPRFSGTAGTQINVEIGASMTSEEQPVWSPAQPFTVGQGYKVDAFATGRYLSVRFSSVSGQPWRIKSYDLNVVNVGKY